MIKCFVSKMGGVSLLPLVFLAIAVGCGGPPPQQPSPPIDETSSAPAMSVQITAQDIALDVDVITASPDALVTLVFTNNENPVIFHNIAIYEDSAATKSIMVGEFIPGGQTATYQFTAPSTPGTYFFRCDIHPFAMHGELIVQ